jgi:hypothetical protein
MKLIIYRAIKVLAVTIFMVIFVSGCVSSYHIGNMGMIEPGKINSAQEFNIDKYKMKIHVISLGEESEYIYSIALKDKYDGSPINNVKSTLNIKKYPSLSMQRDRHRHGKQMIKSGIEPITDTLSNDYDYKYKFNGKGKYELTIKLTEIDGKELEKDILVSFDQEVK